MEKKANNKRERIKSKIREALVSSTSHGIPNIFSSDNLIQKFVWIVFTLIATSLCGYLILENIINYKKYEVSSKTQIVFEEEPIFPSVTFCNGNFITKYSKEIFEKLYPYFQNTYDDELNRFQIIKEIYAFSNYNLSYLKELGDSKSDLIGPTTEKSLIPLPIQEYNLEEHFTQYFDNYYGNCFTFNSFKYDNGSKREPLRANLNNHGFVFTLILDLNEKLSEYFSKSAIVFIHEFGSWPKSAEPISILPGQLTNIAIKKTLSKRLAKPYSNCDHDTDNPLKYKSEYFKAVHNISKKYKQSLCIRLCFENLVLRNCPCYLSLIPNFDIRNCLNNTEEDCPQKVNNMLTQNNYLNSECVQKCPLECEFITYSTKVSTKKFLYKDNMPVSRVQIYFENLYSTEFVETELIDIPTLLSNIGGIAGLFLGVSVLSFVEIVSLIIELLRISLAKNSKVKEKMNESI
ncbi:unnamed protein product [Brachionus calyciflorus]|uniref:Uncharacterized protein n=1 Tax=Brachionus calyciflorus TaxID=104777 RepID=A0A813W5J4_9BILA|nr:unnamed protein product [Brachionus calyciflorus]